MNELNCEQSAAVSAIYGPILISAGAGSGKTTVLTARIKKLITEYNVHPSKILVVTFTNRAANEIKSRLAKVVDSASTSLWTGTFHSICMRMLRIDGHLIGCGSEMKVIDKLEQRKLMKQLSIPKIFQAADVLEAIDTHKNTGMPLRGIELRSIYFAYEKLKQESRMMDYSDLLINANKLLSQHDAVACKYREMFEFICVDEYQDTNGVQNTWLQHLINQEKSNIFCVGDEDQSIFEWRGSDPKLIREFHLSFSKPTKLTLETNYRSTGNILNASNYLIAHNKIRTPKVLKAHNEHGNPVYIYELQDEMQEARHVIKILTGFTGTSAILCRTAVQMKVFEDTCRVLGVRYQIVGDASFYDRPEVKDVIAYAKFFLNPEVNLERIINIPRRDITAKRIEQLRSISLYGILDAARQEPKLNDLFVALDAAQNTQKPQEILKTLLELSGYMAMRNADPTKDAAQRKENVMSMINQASKYNDLKEFCDDVELGAFSGPDSLLLMTLHSSKGLEFDNVALPGWEEGLVPHIMSLNEGKIEEERRLAYVGMTRARKNLLITLARYRFRVSQNKSVRVTPSRFISELPMSAKWISM